MTIHSEDKGLKISDQENFKLRFLLQGVLAICGLEFRGFAIGGFLKPSKSPHFVITPSFLESKMLKNGYFFKLN